MATFPAPTPVYLGPAKYDGGGGNKPIDRIVIHGTTGTNACRKGFARIIARYFRITDRAASAHYVVDPFEVVQVVFDSLIAYHAPPNAHSLAVELCDAVVGPLSRWDDEAHQRMLKLAARLVAELCLAYDVPVRWVGPVRLRLGVKGITSHANVSKAWSLTDHWDPGKWPRREFMRLVRAEVDEIRAEADHHGATRITKFRDEAEALIAKYLDPAVERGRKGRVEEVRDNLRAELARLPRR